MRATPTRWDAGWWSGAARIDSPHADRRDVARDGVVLLVVHSISLPPGQYGGDGVERLFTGTLDTTAHPYFERLAGLRVSSHFFVRRDGSVVQFVCCDRRAWHAGVSAWRGRSGCNDFSIGVELEGLEHTAFEPAQDDALARLVRALRRRYPLEAIVGHEHVAPGRKQDPGRAFEWDRLRRASRCPRRMFADIDVDRVRG
jgi:N-acetyl-anhydromuramoyl-L-alanine amidase